MTKRTVYYHVIEDHIDWLNTDKEGLKASSDGYIYLFTREDIGGYVAKKQLCLFHSYGVVKIDAKGITGKIEADNVGKCMTKFMKRVKQSIIKPEYIKKIRMCRYEIPLSFLKNKKKA